MTNADYIFVQNCKSILASPYGDEGMPVRPHWADGTPAHTKKVFTICNRYDLRKELPIMTLRRIYWKTAFQEILWIYQKASNVIAELGSHIWDSWDVGDGTIGKAYGYQIGQLSRHHKWDGKEDLDQYKFQIKDGWVYLDQMSAVLYDLTHNPLSRSIITTTYIPQDLSEMGLRPCAYSMTYNVTRNMETGEMILNGLLNQRSQDMLTANNWNVIQYALLLTAVANHVGMTPGTLTHMIADCHIYDRHVPIVEDILHRVETTPNDFKAPILHMAKKPFFDLTLDDVKLEGYQYDTTDYKIEVAI